MSPIELTHIKFIGRKVWDY